MLKKYGVVGLCCLFLLTACQPSPTFLASAAPISGHESELYIEVLIEAGLIFVLITGALIWILIRNRSRGDSTLPPQIYGRLSWFVIPVFLILALDGMDFALMVRTMNRVAAPAAATSDLNVQVVGHRWWWEFDYPDLGIATANELHVPVGTTVQISLKSVDVIHSFWIPQLSGKTDVIPGQHNTMWLKADQPGVFLGQCAEFCGTEHALMRFRVIVDSQADFEAWVANQQKPAYEPQTEAEQAGFKEVTGACAACHSIDPSAMDTDKSGPNLAHLFSRTTFAGGTFELNEENLRRWLKDTQAMKPENDMQISVPSQQMDQIVAFLMQLK